MSERKKGIVEEAKKNNRFHELKETVKNIGIKSILVAISVILIVALTAAFITRNLPVAEVEILTWGQIFLQFAYAIISAIVGVYLVYFCVIGLKELRLKRERESVKTEEKENEKEIGTETESLEKDSIINEKTIDMKSKNEKKITIIAFSLVGAYLIINWVLALIAGLI